MPQRNGQNPVRASRIFGQNTNRSGEAINHHNNANMGVGGICLFCNTAVPPRPGFRFSALKCPKCGKSMGSGK